MLYSPAAYNIFSLFYRIVMDLIGPYILIILLIRIALKL